MTHIERISENGLSKLRFGFDLIGNVLQYVEQYIFRRDSLEEPWGDNWPEPLSYAEWCTMHGFEACNCNQECCCLHERYEKYRNTMNPCCFRTKTGEVKMMGQWCHDIKALPPCPDDVAAEALAAYTKAITVGWKAL